MLWVAFFFFTFAVTTIALILRRLMMSLINPLKREQIMASSYDAIRRGPATLWMLIGFATIGLLAIVAIPVVTTGWLLLVISWPLLRGIDFMRDHLP